MKDLADVKWTCPVCGHENTFQVHASDVRLPEKDDIILNAVNIYDEEEIHYNCTVQILRNSITGETSIGWWENEEGEDDET